MDDDNIHTSVVIELANQEEAEDHKTFKIDFNEMETPKDYIIDQIFCGENITVYALFDISEMNNKKPENNLLEIPNPAIKDEYRFIHKNSFKKIAQRRQNGYNRQISMNDSNEDLHFLPKNNNKNKSFHCLKHLGENYEIPTGDDSETELKVLFKKDLIPNVSNLAKFKAVSKGVNTDIAQSPRLIDEVQKALTYNFSYGINDEKNIEITANTSYEIINEMRQSISTLSSDAEIKKWNKRKSPDFVFVPLLMMEDKLIDQFRKEKIQTSPKEKVLTAKTRTTPVKVSLGTNTDSMEFINSTSDDEKKRVNRSSHCKDSLTAKCAVQEKNNEKTHKNGQSHLKKKDKVTILQEIKKLQGKLNALIKSIEFSDVYLSNNEDEYFTEVEIETSEEITEILNKTPQPLLPDSKSFQPSQNKFNEIPIFSPLTLPKKGAKANSKKNSENVLKLNGDLVKSFSSDFIPQQEDTSIVENVCEEEEKPKVKLKNVCSSLNNNWEIKGSWKSAGISKSDTNNRCNLFIPKYNCVKKSMSFDLREDKVEMFCLKKMKNSYFKFEGGLKANMRAIQNGEIHLGDNLTSLTQEMGDEAKRKRRFSKTLLPNFNQNLKKDDVLAIKKNLNEEEGDAKLIYPKQSLISENFVQNPAVLYCCTNPIVSDGLLKSVKNVNLARGKSKTNKTEESGTKASSDPEKPTTSCKTFRKSSTTDSQVKKEVKKIKKLNTKYTSPEKKTEKIEIPASEYRKPKSVSGCRKLSTKGTAESKLHVDKLIKKGGENDLKRENTTTTINQRAVTPNSAERQAGKTDRMLRPRSQRRDLRENTTETSAVDRKEVDKKQVDKKEVDKKEVDKKEVDKKVHKKKSVSALEAGPKEKPSELVMQKKIDHVMVFENKKKILQERNTSENSEWLSSNPSSVVVELLSKKPASMEEFCTKVSHDPSHSSGENEQGKSSGNEGDGKGGPGNEEKPIVKSVWALTKVLLYEDGTKKLEVLEASLTPPGYSLKPGDKN